MSGILAKIGEDWFFPAAVLLILFLLATASPLVPHTTGPDQPPPFENYGRMINLKEAPALPAFLFRLLTIVFLTLLLSGLVINLQGLLKGQWRVFPPGSAPAVPWGVAPVVKLALYFIALFLLLLRLEKIFLGLLGVAPREIQSGLLLVNAFLQFAILLGLSIIFLRGYRPARSAAFRPSSGKPVSLPALLPCPGPRELRIRVRQAFRGYICFFPLLVILILIAWGLTRIFDLPWQSHPLFHPLLERGSAPLLWPLLLVGIVLGPLAEELFFRGLLFPALAGRIREWGAVTVTAALFATLHFNWAGWIPIFGLGVLLARSYARTGSLLVPVLIHGLHNALFLAFTILVYQLT
ncbi:MAG: type II CAAX endopeptidase family protein [Candidatus Erginobacter occultus]|nr:type II CAAX endopeptidase family protein [Candidatus Erginobacter occultus]